MSDYPQANVQQDSVSSSKKDRSLFGMTSGDVAELLSTMHQPSYRAGQLQAALYKQLVSSFDEMTTLPAALRRQLAAEYSIGLPEIVQAAKSVDGTERYLMRMSDGETVETVWMPGGDDGERGDGTLAADEEEKGLTDGYKRATICISSQVGCAVNCQFCLTARLGIRRNLTAGEIAGQVAAVLRRHKVEVGRDRINLVFMGMGEPFLNYDNFMAAVRLLVLEMGIPESRMTVSTSGILPGIEQFAAATLRPKLALSLNGSNDSVRESIMPITRKWNIEKLLEAVSKVPLKARERVTFEYVLLGGVNDSVEHARELVALVRGMRAKVNLIVWNSGPDMPFHEPRPEDVSSFQQVLRDADVPAYIRKPRGRDIYAACGQLKRTVEATSDLVTIGI